MREVVSYITSDEQLFHDKDAALAHEAAIQFAYKYRVGGMPNVCSYGGEAVMPSILVEWLLENKKEVLKLYGVNHG